MKRKTVTILAISLTASLLMICLMTLNYYNGLPKAGGFTRILQPGIVFLKDSLNIGYSFYLAGMTSDSIYLGHARKVNLLFKSTHDFADTASIQLGIPTDWVRTQMRVDSPFIYAMDGSVPGIMYSHLSSSRLKKSDLKPIYFADAILISPKSFIFKAYDGDRQQEVLTKKGINILPNDRSFGILETQNGEGLFSLKGQLEYEPKSKRLLYMYSYRNQIISLDTGLAVQFKSNTIDTISTTMIKLVKASSSDNSSESFAPSKPPLLVNRRCRLTPDYIFVNSALKADNELKHVFKQNSVIDVYATNTGEYKFSFYIPDFQDQTMADFMVNKNTFVGLFGNYICIYELRLPVSSKEEK